jgi:hypothetical protein
MLDSGAVEWMGGGDRRGDRGRGNQKEDEGMEDVEVVQSGWETDKSGR